MVKGINVEDIVKSLPAAERLEFANRLKAQGVADVTLTVAGKGRKRKHRWGSVKGRVVAIRFTDAQYEVLEKRAADENLSVGDYLKSRLDILPDGRISSHHGVSKTGKKY